MFTIWTLAGVWTARGIGFVDHVTTALHWTEVFGPPVYDNSVLCANLGECSQICAYSFALLTCAAMCANVKFTVLEVFTAIDSVQASTEWTRFRLEVTTISICSSEVTLTCGTTWSEVLSSTPFDWSVRIIRNRVTVTDEYVFVWTGGNIDSFACHEIIIRVSITVTANTMDSVLKESLRQGDGYSRSVKSHLEFAAVTCHHDLRSGFFNRQTWDIFYWKFSNETIHRSFSSRTDTDRVSSESDIDHTIPGYLPVATMFMLGFYLEVTCGSWIFRFG